MKTINKIILAAMFLVFTVSISTAQPAFPDSFYGDLKVNDGDAPSGVNIVTKVDGEFSGNITTDQDGRYGYSDPADKQLAVSANSQNQPVKFYIVTADGSLSQADELNGSSSFSVDYRAEGDIRNVDLAFDDVSIVTADAGGSYEVDEGGSVELSGSSSGFDSPVYSWSISDDPTDSASLSGSGQDVTFEAPDNLDNDEDVEVELTVSSEQSSKSASNTATVSVFVPDSDSSDGSGGGGGFSVDSNQTDDEEEGSEGDANQTDGDETDDTQDEQPDEDPVRQVDAQVENGIARAEVGQVDANERVQVNVPDESAADGDSSIESVSFSSSSSATNVEVNVEDIGTDFSRVKDSVDNKRPEGKVYSYQTIDITNLQDDSVDQASVNFKVKKSFIEENDASVADVRLNRFSDGEWKSYEAQSSGETETHYSFESEVPGYSTFAITLAEEEDGGLPVIPLILAVIAVAAVAVAYLNRDRIEDMIAGEVDSEGSDGYSFS